MAKVLESDTGHSASNSKDWIREVAWSSA
jgi:hypothetical protein